MKDIFSCYPQARYPGFEQTLNDAIPSLSNREAKIARYMLVHIDDLSFETGASLAEKAGASEVTVGRLLRRLGYDGLRGLKRELKEELADRPRLHEHAPEKFLESPFAQFLDLEIKALVDVVRQCSGPHWESLIDTIRGAESVYVTGFQTVRGLAEDTARRLSLTRGKVRFLSAHDGMLTEWLEPAAPNRDADRECLILIDAVPYAREAPILAKHCQSSGRRLVVFSDELCHWAQKYTGDIVHARSRGGLLLESTVGLTAALSMMVHAVGERDPDATKSRLDQWKAVSRELNLF